MSLRITQEVLTQIHQHGQSAYPEEGAGLLLGSTGDEDRVVESILPLTNTREDSARHNRYLISARDMLEGDLEADKRGLEIVGVFHSHPDHPNQPSEFDREWAMPWFSYIITNVQDGVAVASRSWRLTDDREKFLEEEVEINS
ncbi:MAG: M67 family metallopeptidase [Chloroflexi bacterium]|nr:M67 family metallopeptidase [Chloroflexota bacterium]